MAKKPITPRQMIERLIAFDTTSAKSNLALIDFAEDLLKRHGVPCRRTADSSGKKANLFATLGPRIAGGVVLSGHTDVVPVDGQPWTSDPFKVMERDRRLYGRGTADMKSFIAVALALVPEALAADLKAPIHIAMSYDEEVGCLGVGDLIADVKANLPMPRMVIIGEPTSMKLVTAHKGVSGFETRISGREAHSSQPQNAANAILAAAELVAFIAGMAEERRQGLHQNKRFEPPYTTFNVGTIEGGSALNIVPRHAAFRWEFRLVPGDDGDAILARFKQFAEDQVLPRLRAHAPEATITTDVLSQVPPLRPETDSPAEVLVRLLTGANRSETVAYGTEGGLFQEAGFSTVVCGPGSIDQAHRPDEFIEFAQVESCAVFLRKLIGWAAKG